ncbi:MAG: UDP-N-acetylmuramoyl-L-alanyl-D-glutamate--2,6-diaminopimelate ligase, partial [Bdellovibrionota bacterium]
PSNNTTPGPVELQSLLAEMRDAGCKSVVMEVSSHGLKMHRTAQIAFDAAVFTNLTPEHLDFHPDMEDYFHAKGILFKEMADEAREIGKKPVAIINGEDEYGKRLIRELKQEFLDFSQDAHQLKVDLSGIHGKAHGIEIQSKLTGRFNAFNIAAAVAAAKALQIDAKIISRGIGNLPVVPGRLERVPNTKGIHVLVDYAHKPDALEKVLKTLKDVKGSHRLITVFGCGGDRDRKKRPVMGKIAVELSDHVVITSDNPRTEDPGTIIQEILGGTAGYKNFEVEADRKSAIFAAIQVAKAGDLVVIAGKGHEDYQILGTGKIHFDDREVAAEALKSG